MNNVGEPRWYVVHTFSGYENKVKLDIEKTIENKRDKDLGEKILEVVVPMQDVVEIKNGKKKTVKRKTFPGYVLIKMIMHPDAWFVVRNTRGVTSFVGPESEPVPLTETEALSMGIGAEIGDISMTIDVEVGDKIRVVSGPFEDSVGIVREVLSSKNCIIANFNVFGRETSVELDFEQVIKL